MLGVVLDVVAPTVAKGVIIRRPRMVALAERLNLDQRAVRRVQRLRDRHGAGPLLLPIPALPYALILSPGHVRRVLDQTPEPFATASREKRAALSHFEPEGVLISHGPVRADRRRFNDDALESDRPVHELGNTFLAAVHEEVATLLAGLGERGTLHWEQFVAAWFRLVRRVVLGDGARDDHELTDMLAALRSDANWAFLRPKRRGLRQRFLDRLQSHLARAEAGSLAGMIAHIPASAETHPEQQVPQWLFAFDAAAIATFRALALLATHPEKQERARAELGGDERPFLRACVLESPRLWPTTPMLLRQSTRVTAWDGGTMPARTGILIFEPFFHRDDVRLPFADRFTPELWLGDTPPESWPLIPFSAGPAICPGRNLVLLLASAFLAELLDGRQVRLLPPARLSPERPLPATLNHVALRFAFAAV